MVPTGWYPKFPSEKSLSYLQTQRTPILQKMARLVALLLLLAPAAAWVPAHAATGRTSVTAWAKSPKQCQSFKKEHTTILVHALNFN